MSEKPFVVVRAYDFMSGNGRHSFSIIADDKSVKYVFPKDSELFDGDSRVKSLLEKNNKPSKASEWIKLAIQGLKSYDLREVNYPEDKSSILDALSTEKTALDSEENQKVLISTGQTPEKQDYSSVFEDMMANNQEFADFAEGNIDSLSDETMKQHITDLIVAAGTLDQNPWLEPWLNGQEFENLDFSNGLVLNKPEEEDNQYKDFQSKFDKSFFADEEE
jgi:hypothetical protein